MCGICGYVGDVQPAQLEAMTEAIRHRGPDDAGLHVEDGVGIGHRRLSIIDVAGGRQPMSNKDGDVWIAYNGEVYNYRDLKHRFLGDYEFRTHSDTEVILHLYQEFGDRCVEMLDGMFAFVIWDRRKRRLLLARDRFGIKPLYYAETPQGLVFSSEVKSFLAGRLIEPRVNKHAVDLFLGFRYVPGSATMFEGVKKLEPGHVATYENGSLQLRRYWNLEYGPKRALSKGEATERFTELMSEAVEARLMSEVPLGAFLSGGLDSSFVVALMSGQVSSPVQTFTAALGGGWHDESGHAELVADHLQTEHHVLPVPSEASQALRRIVWHLDEPLADPAVVPTYMLSQLTRRHVTVVLTGEGADELLAGYDKYKAVLYGGRMRRWLGGAPARPLAALANGRVTFRRLAEFAAERDDVLAYEALTAVFNAGEKAALLGPALRETAGDEPYRETLRAHLGGGLSQLDRLMDLDIGTWLPEDVLLKVDKMSMAHGLEARVPFLSHRVAEFLARLEDPLKLKRLEEKHLLRQAMKPLLPPSIVKRRKHGFTVPIHTWMSESLRPVADAAFSRKRIEALGYWDFSYVQGLLQRDLNNSYYRRQFWALLIFDVWHRLFLEGEPV